MGLVSVAGGLLGVRGRSKGECARLVRRRHVFVLACNSAGISREQSQRIPAEPRANQQRTAGRTGPRLQPGHRPVDPQIRQYLFSRMAHGVVVLECGLRVWRALRSTGTACRRCRAGSPTAPGPLQPHTQRPLPPLRDFCCIKANVGGQDPEIALDGEATPPEAPPPQAPPQSMGDAARNFGWAISALS